MREPLDALVIETTGLASLNPVIQTFLRGDAADFAHLSSVVTLVDALHGPDHLRSATPEFLDQIAYADRLILNKVDLALGDGERDERAPAHSARRRALDDFAEALRRKERG